MSTKAYKTREEIYSYLQFLTIGVLSTVSDTGKPYAAVIYFVVDHNLNFFFVTKTDTKKSQNLEKNNNAAITILDPNFPKTVQATGIVEAVQEPDMHTYLLKRISEANSKKGIYYWPPPLSKLNSQGDLILYKFQPDWLRFADFTESTYSVESSGVKTNIFYQIIPPP